MAAAKFSMGDENMLEHVTSPGGFEFFCFGPQGYRYAAPVPSALTFFVDNTVLVADQYGRACKGLVTSDGREIFFAPCAPDATMPGNGVAVQPSPSAAPYAAAGRKPGKYATHLEVVQALEAEDIDWRKLPMAGHPQLTIDLLRSLPNPGNAPLEQLHTIKSETLRRDALLHRLEIDAATDERKKREQAAAEKEYEEALARVKADKVAATTQPTAPTAQPPKSKK